MERRHRGPQRTRSRGNITIRMTGAIRAKIEKEAARTGRSLGAEIEHRLELSFDREEMARMIATAISAGRANEKTT